MRGPSASPSALPRVARFGDGRCHKTLDGAIEPTLSQNVGGPICFLQEHSGLPIGQDGLVKFTMQSKNEMDTLPDAALFPDPGDPIHFS
jgi:hypothetical protein